MSHLPRAGAAALCCLFLGCDADGDEAVPRGGEGVATGGTAVMAESSDMVLPMPLLVQTVLDGEVQDLLYLSLYRMQWEDGRPRLLFGDESPVAIARGYEILGADSATIRFHLRSDLSWSDGQPLTARDVAWTYRAMFDPDLPFPRRDYVEQLDSVVVNNDTTVTFHFAVRYAEMLFHTGHGIVPAHVYENATLAELPSHPTLTDPATHMVVSGPFRIASWERGQRFVLEPNPRFQPRPHLDRLVVRIVPDETTRLVELRTGAIDGMRVSAPSNLVQLRGLEEVRLEEIERRFMEFIAYNPSFEPFADPEIRRALGMALDLNALIDALELRGIADPAASVYSPIMADLRDDGLSPLPYDTAAAAAILAAKGWIDSDGDGIRERNGTPFAFTLAFNSGNQRRADMGTMLQSYWRRIGVEARLQQQEFQSLSTRLIERNYEAAIYAWQVPLSPDVSGMWAPDAMQNLVSYRNPELERLMQTALRQPTPEAAAPHWKSAARLLARDQPYTWLFYMDQVVAVRDRLQGTRIDTYGLYQNAWEWWVEGGAGAGDARTSPDDSL